MRYLHEACLVTVKDSNEQVSRLEKKTRVLSRLLAEARADSADWKARGLKAEWAM